MHRRQQLNTSFVDSKREGAILRVSVVVISMIFVVVNIENSRASEEYPIPDSVEQSLREAGVRASPEALLQAVQDHPEEGVRTVAAMLLGAWKVAEAAPVLEAVARGDGSITLRREAAQSLCRLGNVQECQRLLKEQLSESAEIDPWEEIESAAALAEIGDGSGFEILAGYLNQPEPETYAFYHLEPFLNLKGTRTSALGLIFKALESPSHEVRESALHGIELAASRRYICLEEVESRVESLKSDPNAKVREKAGVVLDYLRFKNRTAEPPGSCSSVERLRTDQNADAREHLSRPVELLNEKSVPLE